MKIISVNLTNRKEKNCWKEKEFSGITVDVTFKAASL